MNLSQTVTRHGVSGKKTRLSALALNALDAGFAAFGVAPQDSDLCASLPQTLGNRPAQCARRADNRRHFTRKIE